MKLVAIDPLNPNVSSPLLFSVFIFEAVPISIISKILKWHVFG